MQSFRAAILFFSYSASRQAREKRWCSGDPVRNHRLAAQFIRRSLNTLKKSGLPVIHFHEGLQCGDSFGQRLENAYADIFAQGYDAVIAVGNDSPDLHEISWQEVTDSLRKGKTVLGPDRRGGAYLIGMNRAHFENGYLDQVPWNSGEVFHSLCSREPVHILSRRFDLNDQNDILCYVRGKHNALAQWLRKIMFSPVRIPATARYFKNRLLATPDGLRAPPFERM